MSTDKLCKVLIVDDELLIRQGIKHSIDWKKEGFHLIGEAANGEEALEMIETLQPHIVITDMVMPVMDGEALTKTIKEKYPEIEVIILSSFGDFDYVRTTFQLGVSDYILKPQLEGGSLLEALQQAAAKIPGMTLIRNSGPDETASIDHVINGVMAGRFSEDSAEFIKNYFSNDDYCLLGIDIQNSGSNGQALLGKIEERLREGFGNISIYRLPETAEIAAFLFNFDSNQQQAIEEFVKALSMSLPFVDQGIKWALTEDFTDFSDLKQIYEEHLLPLMKYHFYLSNKAVLIYDELPETPVIEDSFQLTEFTKLFQRREFEEAFSYVEEYTEKLVQQYTQDEFEFKSLLGNIIFNVVILLGNMEYDSEKLGDERYTFISSIEEAESAQKALAILNRFLDEAKAVIEIAVNDSTPPNMQMLLDYIDKHYAEPLSLTEMGAKFHYNPSYLSKYFSDNYHQGFSDYLKQVRIEKSKELLRKGEESIAKIGVLVGYSDHSYFCRVFKNFTGVSPSSYRRSYSNKGKIRE